MIKIIDIKHAKNKSKQYFTYRNLHKQSSITCIGA
jgi:hypothetical protein